jgi:zinc and cadmium transporter
MVVTLGFFCVAIVGASLLGGALPLASTLTHTRLQLYLSFAAGTMLGATFFHMMPDAVRSGGPGTLPWTACGLLALFFLERFFSYHHHESPENPEDPCPPHAHEHVHGHAAKHAAGVVSAAAPGGSDTGTKGSALHWGAAAFGLAAHSLVGGVALASAYEADRMADPGRFVSASVWGVFIATLVHKPADALTIVSLMLRAGVPKTLTHLVNLGFSLMIPLGVGAFVLGTGLVSQSGVARLTGNALGFSAGTFLCIALSDLLPELQFHAHDRLKLSAALLLGVGLMAVSAFWE